jgi:hypothetical protein
MPSPSIPINYKEVAVCSETDEPVDIPVICSKNLLKKEFPERMKVLNAILLSPIYFPSNILKVPSNIQACF